MCICDIAANVRQLRAEHRNVFWRVREDVSIERPSPKIQVEGVVLNGGKGFSCDDQIGPGSWFSWPDYEWNGASDRPWNISKVKSIWHISREGPPIHAMSGMLSWGGPGVLNDWAKFVPISMVAIRFRRNYDSLKILSKEQIGALYRNQSIRANLVGASKQGQLFAGGLCGGLRGACLGHILSHHVLGLIDPKRHHEHLFLHDVGLSASDYGIDSCGSECKAGGEKQKELNPVRYHLKVVLLLFIGIVVACVSFFRALQYAPKWIFGCVIGYTIACAGMSLCFQIVLRWLSLRQACLNQSLKQFLFSHAPRAAFSPACSDSRPVAMSLSRISLVRLTQASIPSEFSSWLS